MESTTLRQIQKGLDDNQSFFEQDRLLGLARLADVFYSADRSTKKEIIQHVFPAFRDAVNSEDPKVKALCESISVYARTYHPDAVEKAEGTVHSVKNQQASEEYDRIMNRPMLVIG